MTVAPPYPEAARRLGFLSAVAAVLLTAIYAATLIGGLLSLPSPDTPIGDPYFTMLEAMILLLMPVLVGLMAAVQARADEAARPFAAMALVFMSLLAGLTCAVHFTILTIGRDPAIAGQPWAPRLFSFEWPSVAYALDVVGWDFFFALSVLCAAATFRGTGLARAIRTLLIVSGVLALGGLSGAFAGNMALRNIGILGYVGVFPIAAVLMALLFRRGG